MILAPLRGVTLRCFREVFTDAIREAGFTEAVTPFVSAMPGVDPLAGRELAGGAAEGAIVVTPQFIGKDPESLRRCLRRVRAAGFATADLNCGCPFPMVRRKGRGSGILRTPDVLRRMLEVGCEEMGEGRFSVKARLGVDAPDELERLMPILNEFPLRRLAVHARTARQMYAGECDWRAFERVASAAKMPIVANGDLPVAPVDGAGHEAMVGRAFIRSLGEREDAGELLARYAEASRRELSGDRAVLGRLKELVAYWRPLPAWSRRWNAIKICRTLDEFLLVAISRP